MTLVEFLLLLLIAAVCGSLGQGLVGYSSRGCLISVVVGIIGAYLGWLLAKEFNLPILLTINIGDRNFPVIWSIVGSGIFSAILGLINRSISRRPLR